MKLVVSNQNHSSLASRDVLILTIWGSESLLFQASFLIGIPALSNVLSKKMEPQDLVVDYLYCFDRYKTIVMLQTFLEKLQPTLVLDRKKISIMYAKIQGRPFLNV